MTKGFKRLAALLAVCTALGAAGCKDNAESGAATGEGTAEAVTSEPVEETAKVGYIFNGRADGGGTTEGSEEHTSELQSH